jgi:hypothetical protein
MIDQTLKAEAALRFHQLGLVGLPVHYPVDGHCSCRAASCCGSPAKHPAISWKQLRHQSQDALFAMLRDYPRHNLGASLVGSRVVVLDVDPAKGGEQTLAEFEARRGEPLPPTLCVNTGSGARHLYYRLDPDAELRAGLLWFLPGVDVHGRGSMVVIPPSQSVEGRERSFYPGTPSQPAPLPDDVLRRLLRSPTARQRGRRSPHLGLSAHDRNAS